MALHPQAQALLELMESFGDPPIETSTPEAVRALRNSRIRPPTVSLDEIRDVDAGGVPARLYRPSAEQGLGLLVYLHGGGWVLGSLDTHDNLARSLADESGCAVLSVAYRLAPEHPFPVGAGRRVHRGPLGARERETPSGAIPTGSRSAGTRPAPTSLRS